MAHLLSPEELSDRMRLIRSKDTKPELALRRLLHGAGYRYRIHGKGLPGRPDLVFTARRKVIFIHGCFWHQHAAADCRAGKRPRSNTAYWHPKLARNVERDAQHIANLEKDGWGVLTVWECEMRDERALAERVTAFLGERRLADYGRLTRRSRDESKRN